MKNILVASVLCLLSTSAFAVQADYVVCTPGEGKKIEYKLTNDQMTQISDDVVTEMPIKSGPVPSIDESSVKASNIAKTQVESTAKIFVTAKVKGNDGMTSTMNFIFRKQQNGTAIVDFAGPAGEVMFRLSSEFCAK